MPKKLKRCVKKVQDTGKSESEAWAICVDSTGLKPHKKKKAETIQKLIALADHFDESGLSEYANALDSVLEKEAQWQWMKEKGQKLKDWFKTETNLDDDSRNALTKLRQNHWDLIKQINIALKQLGDAHKRINTPQYQNDLMAIVKSIQEKIGPLADKANKAVETYNFSQQQKQPTQPATAQPAAAQPAAQPAAPPATPVVPGEALSPNASTVVYLLKLADRLDEQGETEIVDKITEYIKTAQFQAVKELGQRVWDAGKGMLNKDTNPDLTKIHWDIVNKLKAAYDTLQAARQNINDVAKYPQDFSSAVKGLQNSLSDITNRLSSPGQVAPAASAAAPAAAPAAPVQPAAAPAQPAAPAAAPAPVTPDLARTQAIEPKTQIEVALEEMSPQEMQKILETVRAMEAARTQAAIAPVQPTAPSPAAAPAPRSDQELKNIRLKKETQEPEVGSTAQNW